MRNSAAFAVALTLSTFGNAIGGGVAAQTLPTPTVSPDPLPDVPALSPGIKSPFPFFDDYSWRSFIALNWPAMTGAANRGQPDRSKHFGDATGPRVWTTWKSRFEIFQPADESLGPRVPSGWTSYAGQNPCGEGFGNDVVTLSAFTAFGDFNQAVFDLKGVGNPLIAQNHTYVRYEVRVNQPEFNSIVGHKWYIADNLPTATTAVPFDVGSTEIKAAWRILTDKDTADVRNRYYVVPNAQVFDPASKKCIALDIALVGFHIVTKTKSRPQWIWSTFEHVDNVPPKPKTTEPKPPAGVPFSFNDPHQPQDGLIPRKRPPAISPNNTPKDDPTPMQVIRMQAINEETMDTNRLYWDLPEIKGTVWQNYMLVMTQWPTQVEPPVPTKNGSPFPMGPTTLANTTMETYFQTNDGSTSCMACHDVSNQQGRDFVMFVTIDASRPGEAAVADRFDEKVAGGSLAHSQLLSLSADPMVKSLIEFMDATKNR